MDRGSGLVAESFGSIHPMSISNQQLETWSNQGGTGISSKVYASIQHSLTKDSSPLNGRGVEIFLQGSYANDTNTHGDSDVDVVVLCKDSFRSDLTALTPQLQKLHQETFPNASYLWEHLRDDVLAALRAHYGNAAVQQGKKAIKVKTGDGRMTADVLPAIGFRRYATFVDKDNLTAHWGIHFVDSNGIGITNYPKYHIERGQSKNGVDRTKGRYKPTIRLFKNFRSFMVDKGHLDASVAPSYFIECALHNVPDAVFQGEFRTTVPAIIENLRHAPYANLRSQNGVTSLIGTGPTQWTQDHFTAFINTAKDVWDGS